MLNRKEFQRPAHALRALMQRLQPRILHFVVAFHLLHQQQRIAANAQPADAVCFGVIERRNQAVIFGHIIGLRTQPLAERFQHRPIRLANHHAVGGWPGIAARRAIHIGEICARGQIWLRKKFLRLWWRSSSDHVWKIARCPITVSSWLPLPAAPLPPNIESARNLRSGRSLRCRAAFLASRAGAP